MTSHPMDTLYESDRFHVFCAGGKIRLCEKNGPSWSDTVLTLPVSESSGRVLCELLKEIQAK